jgi:hypothetical protein
MWKTLMLFLVVLAGLVLSGCSGESSNDAGIDAGADGNQQDACDGPGDDLKPDCGFENIPHQPWEGEIIQVAASDSSTCLKMVREADGMAGGFTWTYNLIALTIGHQEGVITIDDPDSMEYEVTHHNFYDVATCVRSGVVYLLETKIDDVDLAKWHYFLTESDEQSQQILWGPFELFPVN